MNNEWVVDNSPWNSREIRRIDYVSRMVTYDTIEMWTMFPSHLKGYKRCTDNVQQRLIVDDDVQQP